MDKYLRIIFSIIIKIFKLHPPRRASRFPFPAGIDNLAGIKKGKKKKKKRGYCLRNQFPVVRNFHPTYTINRCSKTAAVVRSFVSRLFSNFFYSLPPFVSISMPWGQKKKVVRLLRKKLKTIEENFSRNFRRLDRAKSSQANGRRKIIIIFLVER